MGHGSIVAWCCVVLFLQTNVTCMPRSPRFNLDGDFFSNNDNFREPSISKKFDFPDIEYPFDTPRNALFRSGPISSAKQFKRNSIDLTVINNLKKELRDQRKNKQFAESVVETKPNANDHVYLTEIGAFPEMQYPLTASETWGPNFWNPLPINNQDPFFANDNYYQKKKSKAQTYLKPATGNKGMFALVTSKNKDTESSVVSNVVKEDNKLAALKLKPDDKSLANAKNKTSDFTLFDEDSDSLIEEILTSEVEYPDLLNYDAEPSLLSVDDYELDLITDLLEEVIKESDLSEDDYSIVEALFNNSTELSLQDIYNMTQELYNSDTFAKGNTNTSDLATNKTEISSSSTKDDIMLQILQQLNAIAAKILDETTDDNSTSVSPDVSSYEKDTDHYNTTQDNVDIKEEKVHVIQNKNHNDGTVVDNHINLHEIQVVHNHNDSHANTIELLNPVHNNLEAKKDSVNNDTDTQTLIHVDMVNISDNETISSQIAKTLGDSKESILSQEDEVPFPKDPKDGIQLPNETKVNVEEINHMLEEAHSEGNTTDELEVPEDVEMLPDHYINNQTDKPDVISGKYIIEPPSDIISEINIKQPINETLTYYNEQNDTITKNNETDVYEEKASNNDTINDGEIIPSNEKSYTNVSNVNSTLPDDSEELYLIKEFETLEPNTESDEKNITGPYSNVINITVIPLDSIIDNSSQENVNNSASLEQIELYPTLNDTFIDQPTDYLRVENTEALDNFTDNYISDNTTLDEVINQFMEQEELEDVLFDVSDSTEAVEEYYPDIENVTIDYNDTFIFENDSISDAIPIETDDYPMVDDALIDFNNETNYENEYFELSKSTPLEAPFEEEYLITSDGEENLVEKDNEIKTLDHKEKLEDDTPSDRDLAIDNTDIPLNNTTEEFSSENVSENLSNEDDKIGSNLDDVVHDSDKGVTEHQDEADNHDSYIDGNDSTHDGSIITLHDTNR